MADVKKLLGNVALPEYSRLVYWLDSESDGIKIENKNDHRVFSVRIDSETIVINSEGNLSLPIDGITIYVDSEGILKAAGLDVKPGKAVELTNSEEAGLTVKYVNVITDSETILINSENELYVPLDYKTIVIDSENKIALPIDRKTIFIDSESGLLKAAGLTVSEGEAIKITTSEVDGVEQAIIDVRYDDETIILDSENQLTLPLDRRTILVNSEDKIAVPIDELTIVVNSEGKLEVSLEDGEATEVVKDSEGKAHVNIRRDEHTIHLNELENELELWLDTDKAIDVDSEGQLFVKADEKSVFYNSEGQLEIKVDEDRALEITSEGKVAVKVDDKTIKFDSEGRLVGFPEPLMDGVATHVVYGSPEWDSEAINVLFDSEKGLFVDSENRLFIKVDEDTVRFNSEGELEAKTILEGEANHIYDSEGNLKIDVLYDDVTIHLNSENQLELLPDEERAFAVDSEGKLFVKIDDKTIKFNSEGELFAIPEPLKDGVATHVVPATAEWDSEAIDVLYNSEAGLRVNSENELEVVLDSEALEFKDGAIRVLFDHETLVLDSEGQLSVPIDEETIRINSEGKLSADSLPKPLVENTFLHVSSEGEVEWRRQFLNEVELVDDLNAETARLFWYGTSEEYAQLVANSETYDYTLYIINDATPIVAPDHNYNKLDNKPEINGVVLSGNKSLSDFGIQPVLHSGVATNLNNNKVDVQYLAGVLGVDTSNRLYADTYTTAQIDNMLASLRTIRYEATKPAVPVRNTLYYVGTSSPYHMWLYDSYGTEIDLGTSDVRTYSAGPGIAINSSNVISADLDTIINVGSTSVKAPTSAAVAAYAETKDNKVTSISAASTNEQYPSAKLLYDQLQTKIGAVAASDTSLQVLGGTTLTHATPADLGGADTKGTTKKIPQITYDKFGHLQKVEEKDLEVPLSSGDTSLMLNASNELTHVVPSELGAGSTVGGQTVIPQITYDKFGHLQKVTGINVYPPTTSGLNGQLWVSDGVEAGAWTALSSLIRVKSETGTSTTSGSTTIVVNAPAADAGYVRIACIGAYISSTVDGVCWSVPSMTDSQVTFYANGWTGSATITAYTQWLYVRSNG